MGSLPILMLTAKGKQCMPPIRPSTTGASHSWCLSVVVILGCAVNQLTLPRSIDEDFLQQIILSNPFLCEQLRSPMTFSRRTHKAENPTGDGEKEVLPRCSSNLLWKMGGDARSKPVIVPCEQKDVLFEVPAILASTNTLQATVFNLLSPVTIRKRNMLHSEKYYAMLLFYRAVRRLSP